MKQRAVELNSSQRTIVESAIRETCAIRGWELRTMNVRTNHVHAVVSANKNPEAILSAMKANSTRALRQSGLWRSELSPWSYGGSKKYLWDDKEMTEAIAYVECGQGESLD